MVNRSLPDIIFVIVVSFVIVVAVVVVVGCVAAQMNRAACNVLMQPWWLRLRSHYTVFILIRFWEQKRSCFPLCSHYSVLKQERISINWCSHYFSKTHLFFSFWQRRPSMLLILAFSNCSVFGVHTTELRFCLAPFSFSSVFIIVFI